MALGGGVWLAQNKVLPGSYINFVSAANASASLSERGVATMPLALDWGAQGEVFAVTAGEFQKNSLEIFGHPYTDAQMRPMRELFKNARTVYFYRLDTGGQKASCTYADAKYPGSLGNQIKIVISEGEGYVAESNEVFDVATYVGKTQVDLQKGVQEAAELQDNAFVVWKTAGTLQETAATPLTGGSDGTVEDTAYQAYLDKMESYSFHTMGCDSDEETIKELFAGYVKRMREECGIKFQLVLHQYAQADYEGVISVENVEEDTDAGTGLVYWVTGAQAGCAVNKSLTNTAYPGEYTVDVDYTQAQLEAGIKAGKLMLHRVGDEVRVLTDINTFISVSDEKSADFSSNQVVRTLDQIGNDIASIFNTKYLGKIPNDNAGRISLWNDIVKHHNQLQDIRAIEDFDSEDITVALGDTKASVVVSDYVKPVSAMEQLYMTVVVN